MTQRRDTAPDAEAAKHAGKASVRNAIGKLIGDDAAGTQPGTDAEAKKKPPQR